MVFWEAIESQIYGGGWVNVPLLALAAVLFYLLGFRLSFLAPSMSQTPRQVFKGLNKKHSLLDLAHEMIESTPGAFSKKKSDEISLRIKRKSRQFSGMVTSLVSLAPLLGLLGTVIGMIETFSSLGDQSLFSASGGVAGGISQALITTQVGLIIAVPGLLISRFLKRIEVEVQMGCEQLIELHLLERSEGNEGTVNEK